MIRAFLVWAVCLAVVLLFFPVAALLGALNRDGYWFESYKLAALEILTASGQRS